MAPRINIPDKVSLAGLEAKWLAQWERDEVYRFDASVPSPAIYSIDTPPPTVSGSLHIGHVFSYTHPDIIARYQRMQGKEVFYPIGFDDNGVPTERRVQNFYGVRCEPKVSYDPSFVPPAKPLSPIASISRQNFVELCSLLTQQDEKVYEELWRHIGLSVDWSLAYTTVGPEARRISQAGFLRLWEAGAVYSREAPTLWDVDFATAVSQAELEDRTLKGAYHRIAFDGERGEALVIETSRPELIPACVGLVAHPDDVRYQHLFGSKALSPLFRISVPVIADSRADPTKGTGLAMVCTFGDLTDVAWWKDHGLALRTIISRDGKLRADVDFKDGAFPSEDPLAAQHHYSSMAGQRAPQARKTVVDLLRESGALVGEPTPVTHQVKFYEKGDQPLEIVSSRQWFINLLEIKDQLLAAGREMNWHPGYMRTRYENWVEGLNADWNISRQRFFGIPLPVWYPLDDMGEPCYDDPIFPNEADLPLDPHGVAPPGFEPSQRGKAGGFMADPDVMDTWATSSLTPEIAGQWLTDPSLYAKVTPMNLRPQAHEIIRTWLFYTVVRSLQIRHAAPFSDVLISGFVLDPDRKKMSKSKGNVVTPMPLVEAHGADALRYWAANGRPGVDTAIDEGQFRVGRRLAIKIGNAAKFALTLFTKQSEVGPEMHPLDASLLATLDDAIASATHQLDRLDYAGALETIESLFWRFCDDYIELVKVRAYGDPTSSTLTEFSPAQSASGRLALSIATEMLLRAFAPFLPFITEEAWSWWHDSTIHRSAWPQAGEALRRYKEGIEEDDFSDPGREVFAAASAVLGAIRRQKTTEKRSMKAPVTELRVRARQEDLKHIADSLADIAGAGSVKNVTLCAHDTTEPVIEVMLEEIG